LEQPLLLCEPSPDFVLRLPASQKKRYMSPYFLTHLPRHLSDVIVALENLENSSLAERKRLTRAWASKQIKTMRQQKQDVLLTTE